MTRTFIRTTEPLTGEDPTLSWMRREHPERLTARETRHAFVPTALAYEPPDHVCGARCICDVCWERKSLRVHR